MAMADGFITPDVTIIVYRHDEHYHCTHTVTQDKVVHVEDVAAVLEEYAKELRLQSLIEGSGLDV